MKHTLCIGSKVRITDTSADCPSGQGVVTGNELVDGQEFFVVAYSDGQTETFGHFTRQELKRLA